MDAELRPQILQMSPYGVGRKVQALRHLCAACSCEQMGQDVALARREHGEKPVVALALGLLADKELQYLAECRRGQPGFASGHALNHLN